MYYKLYENRKLRELYIILYNIASIREDKVFGWKRCEWGNCILVYLLKDDNLSGNYFKVLECLDSMVSSDWT